MQVSAHAAPGPIDTTARVETPEHVAFDYHVAGPAKRGLAWLIDVMIQACIVVGAVIIAAFAAVGGGDLINGMSEGAMLLLLFALQWGYYALFESLWSGRTPGKRAMRIRVVREGGHPLTVRDALLRNLLRAADWMPAMYSLGLLVMASDTRFRRLGDMVAGTIVVTEDRHGPGAAVQVHPPPTQVELDGLPQRPPVSRDELDAIEVFLRRRPYLAPMRELELAEMIAPILASRMGLRYQDPSRFLALVYYRAHARSGAPQGFGAPAAQSFRTAPTPPPPSATAQNPFAPGQGRL